ncbi:hypothetical protein [Aeromicrobium sp. UC242_57]|uniref:hypothetical protein n=1 Tax=Aeromicrobium sp. UC242_57 TaxID=3374624 RepID=UPI00379BDCDB
MSKAIEHLRVAHHLALKAHHSSEFDAAALMRTWPRLALAVRDVEQALGLADHDRVVERISADAEAIAVTLGNQLWPGPGGTDSSLTAICRALGTTAEHARSTQVDSKAQGEARRLIASIMWTTSRLVGQANRDLHFDLTVGNPDASTAQLDSAARD